MCMGGGEEGEVVALHTLAFESPSPSRLSSLQLGTVTSYALGGPGRDRGQAHNDVMLSGLL